VSLPVFIGTSSTSALARGARVEIDFVARRGPVE
jgi:hypothetical protein